MGECVCVALSARVNKLIQIYPYLDVLRKGTIAQRNKTISKIHTLNKER